MRVRELFDLVAGEKFRTLYSDSDADETNKQRAFWNATRDLVRTVVDHALAAGLDVIDYAPDGSPAARAWQAVKKAWGVTVADLRVGDRVLRPTHTADNFSSLVEYDVVTVRLVESNGTVWTTPYGFIDQDHTRELYRIDARMYGRPLTEVVRVPADWDTRKGEYVKLAFWLDPTPDLTPVTDGDWETYARVSLAKQGWPSSRPTEVVS